MAAPGAMQSFPRRTCDCFFSNSQRMVASFLDCWDCDLEPCEETWHAVKVSSGVQCEGGGWGQTVRKQGCVLNRVVWFGILARSSVEVGGIQIGRWLDWWFYLFSTHFPQTHLIHRASRSDFIVIFR